MLTKKDFIAIARIVAKCHNKAYGFTATSEFVAKIADYLATKNPAFDRDKFIKACGF
jgi:hypothetical protein